MSTSGMNPSIQTGKPLFDNLRRAYRPKCLVTLTGVCPRIPPYKGCKLSCGEARKHADRYYYERYNPQTQRTELVSNIVAPTVCKYCPDSPGYLYRYATVPCPVCNGTGESHFRPGNCNTCNSKAEQQNPNRAGKGLVFNFDPATLYNVGPCPYCQLAVPPPPPNYE